MEQRLRTPEDGAEETERNRLPTLMEVLNRRTLAPVDLFSFYIYMRDQQQSVDYLDFWLDVTQHLSLCRHYVRALRRSVLVETPELEKAMNSKRSSQILDSFDLGDAGRTGSINSDRSRDQRLSQYLRHDSGSRRDSFASHASQDLAKRPTAAQDHEHPMARRNHNNNGYGVAIGYDTTNATDNGTFYNDKTSVAGPLSLHRRDSPQDSTHSRGADSTSPRHSVNRADIRASAEKILYTFLLAGSEREIILPQNILHAITVAIEEHGRDDPEVFDPAKDYVFQAMERDAYPGFLRAKALGNLVPMSLMLRLVVGLLAMFGGFWAAFVLIFLDESRKTRCWLILPFTIGVYSLASHQYSLDPILALAGASEYTFFHFTQVREPYVRKLIMKRGLMVAWWVIWIVAALVCLFVFVPGKRLT